MTQTASARLTTNAETIPHFTAMDHIMAATRLEWTWLHDEQAWDASRSFPDIVIRRYTDEAVYRRDGGRMLTLGYRIFTIASTRVNANQEMKVTYGRPVA
jgi:hypothetical protein